MIQLLIYFVCTCYLLLLISYLFGWLVTSARTGNYKQQTLLTHVSIILPVRNEEKNILSVLQCLSKQNYPGDKYEIIVVDDFSADKTVELAREMNIPNMNLICLRNGQAENPATAGFRQRVGKKNAITEGIAQASGTLIVTTDADCMMKENWLSSIVSFYEEKNPKMIVAPVLLKEKNNEIIEEWKNENNPTFPPSRLPNFHQIFQSHEMTMLTACACASLYYNTPVLCSGANLIYEKEAFFSVNGFEETDQTATGDDILIMLKIHKKFPSSIKYLKSKDAIVFTNPEDSLSGAFGQRKRWASKFFLYGFNHITWVALLVFLTNSFIFFFAILSAINSKFAPALITTFFVKLFADYMLLRSASSFFGKKIYPVAFVFASILYPVYVILIGLLFPFKKYSWKGRIL